MVVIKVTTHTVDIRSWLVLSTTSILKASAKLEKKRMHEERVRGSTAWDFNSFGLFMCQVNKFNSHCSLYFELFQ